MNQSASSDTKSYIRLVLGTLAFVVVLSGVNILIILNSLGTEIFKPLKRNLANVSLKKEDTSPHVPALTITFNCKNGKKTVDRVTKASSLRLLFEECKKVERPSNQSNKSQADLFFLKKQTWTSDFIVLSPGSNIITFNVDDKSQSIEITRNIPKELATDKAL